MPAINPLAVLLATLAAFLIGGFWYGPLFGRAWMVQVGMTPERLQQGFNPVKAYGFTFICAGIAAYIMAAAFAMLPSPVGLATGATYGVIIGLAWVGTSFATSYTFERRSLTLLMINAGYHTLEFAAMGAILGVMS
jgi:hypothetical protein